jgi:hypothetical protein
MVLSRFGIRGSASITSCPTLGPVARPSAQRAAQNFGCDTRHRCEFGRIQSRERNKGSIAQNWLIPCLHEFIIGDKAEGGTLQNAEVLNKRVPGI